jgi:hypothetical protein
VGHLNCAEGHRNDFSWNRDPLDQVRIIGNRSRAAAPRQAKEVERHQTAQHEHGEMGNGCIGKDFGEDKGQQAHHDDGIEERPEHAKDMLR